jgi:hypothetical protein
MPRMSSIGFSHTDRAFGSAILPVPQEKLPSAHAGIGYLYVESERAGEGARLAIVHVSSHSRQRHNVLTVIVLAMVSTRVPRQNGHAVGRVTSLTSGSYMVAMVSSGVKARHRPR